MFKHLHTSVLKVLALHNVMLLTMLIIHRHACTTCSSDALFLIGLKILHYWSLLNVVGVFSWFCLIGQTSVHKCASIAQCHALVLHHKLKTFLRGMNM